MLKLPLAAVLALGSALTQQSEPLRVMRATPQGSAIYVDVIRITFDRPVAAGLDATVEASSIFSIDPPVPGKVEWRDPVTIRFTPSSPLTPGTDYTVTIANNFEAADGSRLRQPYVLKIQVDGPIVLAGLPVGEHNQPPQSINRLITPDEPFELLLSAPADEQLLRNFASSAYVSFQGSCGGSGRIALRPGAQRPVSRDTDDWPFRRFLDYGPYSGEAADRLRVLELIPVTAMPKDCAGLLSVPVELSRPQAGLHNWQFRTYGPLRFVAGRCGGSKYCPTGPIILYFTTPVRGSDVLRHVKVFPNVAFELRDTASDGQSWVLEAELEPRRSFAVVLDAALTDVFGQQLQGDLVRPVATTSYAPWVSYPQGRWLVERQGPRTLAVEHINVDSLEVLVAPIPRSYERHFLSGSWWQWRELWDSVAPGAARRMMKVTSAPDRAFVTGVRMLAHDASRPGRPTLMAVRFDSPQLDTTVSGRRWTRPIAVVQVTDLAIQVRLAPDRAFVWVTGASDGEPRTGAEVALYDARGRAQARGTTDSRGHAELTGFELDRSQRWGTIQGYIAATMGEDRAVVGLGGYDPYLSPWNFNIRAAWGKERAPFAAAVFTERGIYRPGEPVYAKAIVRKGTLGSLRVPADSLRWRFADREAGTLKDTTVALSRFGTSDQRLDLPTDLALGHYQIHIDLKQGREWQNLASTGYRVAEYRPPEFLVDATSDTKDRFAGDTLQADVEARYLFGAPMGRAAVTWVAREQPMFGWQIDVPSAEGFYLGEWGTWWDASELDTSIRTVASQQDTLDMAGHLTVKLSVPAPRGGRPARTTVEATVTDINRQSVSAATSVTTHPAAFYIGIKPEGERYFWQAGQPQDVSLIAITPEGNRVSGVAIEGTIVRREWHQVRRQRGGRYETIGEWVSDTVATCGVTSTAEPQSCRVTPAKGGTYILSFKAKDNKGRVASSSIYRWVVGEDWVPWYDESQFKMDVIADKDRYRVGDTATVLFASPFTDAEAWVTVEREGVIEQRKLRITSGSTTLKFPITEAFTPNAFVSIVVVRGRTEPPGPPDDPGRPTLRVGYAELRVAPEVKRLTVDVRPLQAEYRPGDSARVELQVRDATGRGQAAEVTLWAVDEGVLALTGYRTPDPIDLIYRPRGLGVVLASNLVAVAEQVAAEEAKAKGEPGGGGGMETGGYLRSQFRVTAFFLGSVVTDASGRAVASAKLPDNLTTFRVMAVAVTAGDRYGSGESKFLVTLPLLARPALPRFVREEDRFAAGVVVNHRLAGTPTVTVESEVEDAQLLGERQRQITLEPGRGSEARFRFQALAADSATFRFKVSSGAEADAVQRRIPVRPSWHPRGHTVAGVLWDTASAEIVLPGDIDPARSTLEINFGGSPLAFIKGVRKDLQVYPYYCSEQVASAALPLIALYRAQTAIGESFLSGDPKAEIELAVAVLSRRQGTDGGIGFWHSDDWSSPWLSAYAGRVLLEARAAGIPVKDQVLRQLADYLRNSLRRRGVVPSPLVSWYRKDNTFRLAEAVAAVDFLSRIGEPDLPAENSLLRQTAQMAWEDRVALWGVLARRDPVAARNLLAMAWSAVQVQGRRAVLPDSLAYRNFYFPSTTRPTARLLAATLAVDPENALVGPLVATLVSQGRVAARSWWTTQDLGSLVLALLEYERFRSILPEREVQVRSAGRTLAAATAGGTAPFDTATSLQELLVDRPDGAKALRFSVQAARPGGPVYYYFTVREIPVRRPVRPGDSGIVVERWYERYDQPGEPIISASEGELVRVKLRVTVPNERHFFVLDDALPGGLEPVDVSLRTEARLEKADLSGRERDENDPLYYGGWYYGYWSPFDHRELRDDRVVFAATVLWRGTYHASYVARATTPGTFVRPPAHAEEMYNPAVNGRSDGGEFTVSAKGR